VTSARPRWYPNPDRPDESLWWTGTEWRQSPPPMPPLLPWLGRGRGHPPSARRCGRRRRPSARCDNDLLRRSTVRPVRSGRSLWARQHWLARRCGRCCCWSVPDRAGSVEPSSPNASALRGGSCRSSPHRSGMGNLRGVSVAAPKCRSALVEECDVLGRRIALIVGGIAAGYLLSGLLLGPGYLAVLLGVLLGMALLVLFGHYAEVAFGTGVASTHEAASAARCPSDHPRGCGTAGPLRYRRDCHGRLAVGCLRNDADVLPCWLCGPGYRRSVAPKCRSAPTVAGQ
jgi:hypothetical protein